MAAAILLSALGVPWKVIRDDYHLTTEYRGEQAKVTLEKIRTMGAIKGA